MGKLLNGYILPHPPVIIPDIGNGREREAESTILAAKEIARQIKEDNPTTIIISTPHAPCFRDYVYIPDFDVLEGDFQAFGEPKVGLSFENNKELGELITAKVAKAGVLAGSLDSQNRQRFGIGQNLDHGALVPLYFVVKELKKFKLVCISTPLLSLREIYNVGICIGEAVAQSNENVVYIASADLSHRLTEDAPSGYNPRGQEYDLNIADKLRKADVKSILEIDQDFMEAAGECGTRSIVMLLGALEGTEIETDILSYEGPFGVGYLVAKVGKKNQDYLPDKTKNEDIIDGSKYVKLAKETLEKFVKEKTQPIIPNWIPSELISRRAGAFVSIKKNGALRGCIGTIGPTRENLGEEIMQNAISAGTGDPRFPPVSEEELGELVYSVDVLGKPEKIKSMSELDVEKYGVIVTSGFRRGLLLPDLEGIDSPEMQVAIALQKAGIDITEPYELERFEVIRYR